MEDTAMNLVTELQREADKCSHQRIVEQAAGRANAAGAWASEAVGLRHAADRLEAWAKRMDKSLTGFGSQAIRRNILGTLEEK